MVLLGFVASHSRANQEKARIWCVTQPRNSPIFGDVNLVPSFGDVNFVPFVVPLIWSHFWFRQSGSICGSVNLVPSLVTSVWFHFWILQFGPICGDVSLVPFFGSVILVPWFSRVGPIFWFRQFGPIFGDVDLVPFLVKSISSHSWFRHFGSR